jgi:hypothetical protein
MIEVISNILDVLEGTVKGTFLQGECFKEELSSGVRPCVVVITHGKVIRCKDLAIENRRALGVDYIPILHHVLTTPSRMKNTVSRIHV